MADGRGGCLQTHFAVCGASPRTSPVTHAQEAPGNPAAGSPEAALAAGAADPARAAKRPERDRLWKSAQELASSGQTAEAIREGHQVLELDQALFGPTADETKKTAEWLRGQHQELGRSYENGEEWEKAKEEYQRGVEVLAAAFGAAHWRTREAEWKGRTVELLKAMSADDRASCAAAMTKYRMLRLDERRAISRGPAARGRGAHPFTNGSWGTIPTPRLL